MVREEAVDKALALARSAPLNVQAGVRQGAGRVDSLLGGEGPQPVRRGWGGGSGGEGGGGGVAVGVGVGVALVEGEAFVRYACSTYISIAYGRR